MIERRLSNIDALPDAFPLDQHGRPRVDFGNPSYSSSSSSRPHIFAHAFANAIIGTFQAQHNQLQREIVVTIPFLEDRGLHQHQLPRTHRFRSSDLKLVERIRVFRREHDLTQAEVAAVVEGSSDTTVTQWERGVNVPNGIRRERAVALVEGRLWPEIRSSVVDGVGIPSRWWEAARWYRRASRDIDRRQSIGTVIAAILGGLRGVVTVDALCQRYGADSQAWTDSALPDFSIQLQAPESRRRAEDAAFGLRWLELRNTFQLDLGRSLIRQLSPEILASGPKESKK